MAVPRPVMLALAGLALIAGLFFVMHRNASESVKSTTAPVKPAITPQPAAPKKAKTHKSAGADRGKRAAHDAKPAKAAHRPKPAAAKAAAPGGVAGRVLAAAKALGENKVVVFFFSKPGAADDVGARVAMKSLRGMKGVEIFDAGIDEVAAYRPMLASVGISQVPATVIVRPGKKAVLLEGFVDAGTLRQNVADALR